MELGVGEALTSFLDEKGIPSIVQYTKIICPQSLMAPCDDATRRNMMRADGMSKYDQMVDNESAYELLAKAREKEEEEKKLEEERAQLQKEREEFEKMKAKEEEAARKKQEKEEEAARKKKEKEEEAAKKKKEREEEAEKKRKEAAADRRKAKIESQLISAGGQILKRGLLNTLFKK